MEGGGLMMVVRVVVVRWWVVEKVQYSEVAGSKTGAWLVTVRSVPASAWPSWFLSCRAHRQR